MSLNEKFSKEYEEAVEAKQQEVISGLVNKLRTKLTSKDESKKKQGEIELSEIVVDSKDTFNTVIQAFIRLDCFANQCFKGKANRVGETIQPSFLSKFVKQQTNEEIEFCKPKQKTIVHNTEVYYTISNQMNNYNNNVITDWSSKKLDKETILVCGGKSVETMYEKLKSKKINNLKVVDIEEFIKWIKQN
jgi:hypothetical protein